MVIVVIDCILFLASIAIYAVSHYIKDENLRWDISNLGAGLFSVAFVFSFLALVILMGGFK